MLPTAMWAIQILKLSSCGLTMYIYLNYNELVSIFGKPLKYSEGDNKVEWEWLFKLDDSVITIYNWKDGPLYNNDKKIRAKDITDWHVGGKFLSNLHLLEQYILQKNGNQFLGRRLTREAS